MASNVTPAMSAAQRVQRVLARFELGCPALRDYQLTVHLMGKDPQVVVLPAAARARGAVEIVMTAKGRLRTCLFPSHLAPRQVAAVEDLAWALYETLADDRAAARRSAEQAEPA